MKRALIVYGGWPGHQPVEFQVWASERLSAEGVEVEAVDSLEPLEDQRRLEGFDLIVPIWTMGELSDEQEKGLKEAVRNGVGLAGWHGGMGDAFRSRPTFQFMVGGQFVAHPGGDDVTYVVKFTGDDELTRGLSDFSITSEQYYLHVDPSNEVLATTVFSGETHPWVAGVEMPVAWKRRWGEGRVFYSSLGHQRRDFDIPEVAELTLRGMLWAAR
ncbi:MAG TPA: ThuA domain-containing protein [Trueperaceae bacterium]